MKSYSYYSHLYRTLQYIFIWLCFRKSFCSQLFFLVNVAHVGSSNIDISQASNIDKLLSALALLSNHYLLLYHVYINNLWVQLRLFFKLSVYYNALFIKKTHFPTGPQSTQVLLDGKSWREHVWNTRAVYAVLNHSAQNRGLGPTKVEVKTTSSECF